MILDNTNQLRVIVTQMGARHNYGIPRMFAKQGALVALYTDFCLTEKQAHALKVLECVTRSTLMGKLRRRTVVGLPPALVRSLPWVNFRSSISQIELAAERYAFENEIFSRSLLRRGVRDANILYTMWGSGSRFWEFARQRGLKVVIDVFITPMFHRIVTKEEDNFLSWIGRLDEKAIIERHRSEELIDTHVRDIISYADLLVCPSQSVIDGLKSFVSSDETLRQSRALSNAFPETVVVPYGHTIPGVGRGKPIAKRILFAGEASLRKGIHYLAMAANLLARRGRNYEFRIAGPASESVINHPEAANLTFLGHLSRERMAEEYSHADLFVLPTLAEGSASVVYEAMAAGVPVITTEAAGSVITSMQDGLIVNERDPIALADAIELVTEDRRLRNKLGDQAISTAESYNLDNWLRRLSAVLPGLLFPAR